MKDSKRLVEDYHTRGEERETDRWSYHVHIRVAQSLSNCCEKLVKSSSHRSPYATM